MTMNITMLMVRICSDTKKQRRLPSGAVAVACTIVVNKNQLLDFDFLGFLGWFL